MLLAFSDLERLAACSSDRSRLSQVGLTRRPCLKILECLQTSAYEAQLPEGRKGGVSKHILPAIEENHWTCL